MRSEDFPRATRPNSLEIFGEKMENKVKMVRGDCSWSGYASRVIDLKIMGNKKCSGALRRALRSTGSSKRNTCACYATSFELPSSLPHTALHHLSPRPAPCLSNPMLPQWPGRCRRRPPCRHPARGCVACLATCGALCWEHNSIHFPSSHHVACLD